MMEHVLIEKSRAGRQGGFSLMELLVVVALISVLASIATPAYMQWRRNLVYRDAARQIVSFLREAKNQAITTNRQRRADFDTANRRFGLRIGDRASDTNWSPITVAIWNDLNRQVTLVGPNPNTNQVDPDNPVIHVIVFNPSGTVVGTNTARIIVRDDVGADRFWIEVTPSGRIRAERQ